MLGALCLVLAGVLNSPVPGRDGAAQEQRLPAHDAVPLYSSPGEGHSSWPSYFAAYSVAAKSLAGRLLGYQGLTSLF